MDQAHAAQGPAVGIAVGAGVEVDPQMATSRGETGFQPDPNGSQFNRIPRAEAFNGAKAVGARWQWSPGAGAVSVRGLAMGPAGDRVEVKVGRARGLELELPDRITREGQASLRTAQNQAGGHRRLCCELLGTSGGRRGDKERDTADAAVGRTSRSRNACGTLRTFFLSETKIGSIQAWIPIGDRISGELSHPAFAVVEKPQGAKGGF